MSSLQRHHVHLVSCKHATMFDALKHCQTLTELARVLQVSLLDPVVYPGAIKAFAREACRK